MRIRSTKPEFWRSARVASVDWHARLVLKGLESYVDDNGVGKDDVELIIGDLFQRDAIREGSRTLARVSEALGSLHHAGLLWRYEHEGTPLLYLAFWESFQRVDKPQAGRFPRPDGTWNYRDSLIREPVANVREPSRALAPGTGEQGNRGTGEQDAPHAAATPNPTTPKTTKATDRKPRAASLPASWTPTDEHRTRATESALDIEREATKFRAYNDEKGRTAANWNAAFTRWLINAAEYAQRDGRPPASAQPPRRSPWDALPTVSERRQRDAATEGGTA